MRTIKFDNFGMPASGRVVTGDRNVRYVFSRNPYGGHGLVAVDAATGQAFRHGNLAVTLFAANWGGKKIYRKLRGFLATKFPATRNWVAV